MRRIDLPAAAIVGAVFALAVLAWAGLFALREQRTADGWDVARWEVTNVWNKWLFALGGPLRADPDPDAAIALYFALDDRSGAEGRRLENAAEAAVEGRIDAVLREQGVDAVVPLPGALAVWPPVDIEFAGSPWVLVTSPRSRIERANTELLRPDLPPDRRTALEHAAEAADTSLSALVVPTGGFSVYPAVVSDRGGYAATLGTAAHEWAHHYLAFFPLGLAALSSADALTISETVASIAGDEIARLAIERFGDPTVADPTVGPSAASPPSPPSPPETVAPAVATVDRAAVLRALRLEVDALLAAGDVAAAEWRMEEVRGELWEAGVRIRRLNQAYFAWYGSYAARPDAVDPLGEQLRAVREQAGSLAAFLSLVRGARSRADVERMLAGLAGSGG